MFGNVHVAPVGSGDGSSLFVISDTPLTASVGDVFVWGVPVGDRGKASDAEVRSTLDRPDRNSALLGVWCLATVTAAGVRFVTSASMVHTLKRAEAADVAAVATRGMAALALLGKPPLLATERIAEFVLFDFVSGNDELIEGTHLIDEAAMVEVRAGGVRTSSWWPTADRFERGAPTDAVALRSQVGQTAARLASADDAELGLTGGRDSALVLSCLAERAVLPPTFTLGAASSPDSRAAAVMARAVGAPHRQVVAPAHTGFSPERVLQWTAWTEGLDPPFNLLFGSAELPGPSMCWMTGHGGEIGRAFYWQWPDRAPDRDPPSKVIVGPAANGMTSDARAALFERIDAAAQALRDETGRSGADLIDVFYARNRMRNWLARHAPYPQLKGFLPVYLEPTVVRALVDIPEEDRRTGRVFDAAIGMGELRRPVLAGANSLAGGITKVRRRLPRSMQPRDLRVMDEMLDDSESRGSLTREALGDTWWTKTRSEVRFRPAAKRMLWNALAVDYLARWIEGDDFR